MSLFRDLNTFSISFKTYRDIIEKVKVKKKEVIRHQNGAYFNYRDLYNKLNNLYMDLPSSRFQNITKKLLGTPLDINKDLEKYKIEKDFIKKNNTIENPSKQRIRYIKKIDNSDESKENIIKNYVDYSRNSLKEHEKNIVNSIEETKKKSTFPNLNSLSIQKNTCGFTTKNMRSLFSLKEKQKELYINPSSKNTFGSTGISISRSLKKTSSVENYNNKPKNIDFQGVSRRIKIMNYNRSLKNLKSVLSPCNIILNERKKSIDSQKSIHSFSQVNEDNIGLPDNSTAIAYRLNGLNLDDFYFGGIQGIPNNLKRGTARKNSNIYFHENGKKNISKLFHRPMFVDKKKIEYEIA